MTFDLGERSQGSFKESRVRGEDGLCVELEGAL